MHKVDSKKMPNTSFIQAARYFGSSITDAGLFEINLENGRIEWANQFVVETMGYSLSEIQTKSIYDFVPDDLVSWFRNELESQKNGKHFKFAIWPKTNSRGEVVWWYVTRHQMILSTCWYKCQILGVTDRNGSKYSEMFVTMTTANGYNELYNKIIEIETWTKGSYDKLERKDSQVDIILEDHEKQLAKVTMLTEQATETLQEMKNSFSGLKTDMQGQFTDMMKEITTLIKNDTHHDRRISEFERHVRETTEQACKAITVKASDEGKELSKKVVIPVGVTTSIITAIAALIQWFIHNQ